MFKARAISLDTRLSTVARFGFRVSSFFAFTFPWLRLGSPFKSFRRFVLFNRFAPLSELSGSNSWNVLKILISALSALGEFKSIVRIRLEVHSLDPGGLYFAAHQVKLVADNCTR